MRDTGNQENDEQASQDAISRRHVLRNLGVFAGAIGLGSGVLQPAQAHPSDDQNEGQRGPSAALQAGQFCNPTFASSSIVGDEQVHSFCIEVPERVGAVSATRLDPGATVTMSAGGSINGGGVLFGGESGPEGWNPSPWVDENNPNLRLPGSRLFALLYKIVPAGRPASTVSWSYLGRGPRTVQWSRNRPPGDLYLGLNDDIPGNGSGSFFVRVTTREPVITSDPPGAMDLRFTPGGSADISGNDDKVTIRVDRRQNRITFEGEIMLGTGCIIPELEEADYDADTGLLEIVVGPSNRRSSRFCAQVISPVKYSMSAGFDGDFPQLIRVIHESAIRGRFVVGEIRVS